MHPLFVGKTLDGEDINDPIFQREVDVPEEVDGILEQLFSSLQDKVHIKTY